jgi:type I restriction enzyme M protein
MEVVRTLQSVAFTRTDIDTIGHAFERFFGSIFRGGLGQYFTMRQLARFAVGVLNITADDFVLDPTAGSGGFLLEALLQVWHRVDREFAGQPSELIARRKTDFALQHVYGVEIHEILARICKINLLLHHDGHTNIESGRSILDSQFVIPRVAPDGEGFTCIVGNPPFGTDIRDGDEEQLGGTAFRSFHLATGFNKVDSEQLILERCVSLLQGGGRLSLILPDGTLNNQSVRSNAPQLRAYLARQGRVMGVVSLPDHAFRKSGAQNKTSILFFQKFTAGEKRLFDRAFDRLRAAGVGADEAIPQALENTGQDYPVFLGEAEHVGYTPSGIPCEANDLYRSDGDSQLTDDQTGTILGEYRDFQRQPHRYQGTALPDTAAMMFSKLWRAHPSHRLDPKYHLFKLREADATPAHWVRARLGDVLARREERVDFAGREDELFTVLTVSQTGELRAREAGKGNNPPEWRGSYFNDSPGDWYRASFGDVVFSSIDLWKGCIAVVPEGLDGALVTTEFPIYQVVDSRLLPQFLQILLRSRFFLRAFRAITTGHSNRRRTQQADFEDLEIAFPPSPAEQLEIIERIAAAREQVRDWGGELRDAMMHFNDLIDGRGAEDLPPLDPEEVE